MTRGGLSFAEKTTFAQQDGCVGAIIHNNQPGSFAGTLGAEGAWIPVVGVGLNDGLYLKQQIDAEPTTATLYNVKGDYAVYNGTSMASPHVTGVVALLLSKKPWLKPADVRSILRASANDLGAPGWDPLFGHGRVNARKAVTGR
jgi:serine protease